MNSEFSEIGFTLEPGDRVLVYTDGLLEATNSKGEEYGASRLMESVQKPSASARAVLADVQEFSSGGTLTDDATAIGPTRRECDSPPGSFVTQGFRNAGQGVWQEEDAI